MKINISNPATGCNKLVEIDETLVPVNPLIDKRLAQEFDASFLGPHYEGYIFKITGGNDKQGVPMKQGVLVNHRVRLLLNGKRGFFNPKRKGDRRRKSVRGCIIANDVAVISAKIVKKGKNEIPGLTDVHIPRRLGPKRASKIRKLFNLTKEEDVRHYVIRREIKPKKEGQKVKTKAPKIQRLVTPERIQRKRYLQKQKKKSWLKAKQEAANYSKVLLEYLKTQGKKKEELKLQRKLLKEVRAKKITKETAKSRLQKLKDKHQREAEKKTAKKKPVKNETKEKNNKAKTEVTKKEVQKKGNKKEQPKKDTKKEQQKKQVKKQQPKNENKKQQQKKEGKEQKKK